MSNQRMDFKQVDLDSLPEITRLFIKQFKPVDGSVVVVKRPGGVEDEQFNDVLRKLADDILTLAGVNVILIGVDSFSELKYMDDEKMEKVGWVRKDRVLAFKEDKFEDLVKGEEE